MSEYHQKIIFKIAYTEQPHYLTGQFFICYLLFFVFFVVALVVVVVAAAAAAAVGGV